jgi:hypothetical protein
MDVPLVVVVAKEMRKTDRKRNCSPFHIRLHCQLGLLGRSHNPNCN